jgi:hypothetical protein
MPAVLHPFRYITSSVMKPKRVWLKRTHAHGSDRFEGEGSDEFVGEGGYKFF